MKGKIVKNGFTLIEILLVIILIGILAGITLPSFTNQTSKGKEAAAKAEINGTFNLALSLYELHIGSFPSTEEGLKALVEKPTGLSDKVKWEGPYIKEKEVPLDPFGNEYFYECPPKHGIDYDLSSSGADGIKGNEDDITNWKK